ncbi:MAG: phage holin family protein [Actinomycetales bacterium]|jgi:putative membrane protein|nr:phage holin family protein [Actinomycetales bacterium]
MRFVIRLIVNGLSIWVAAWLLQGISLVQSGDTLSQIVSLAVVALVFTLVHMIVKPIVAVLSLPLYILTLGLFHLIVNALMLLLTGWISTQIGQGLQVDGFWWAFAGSLVISIASWLLYVVIPDRG